MKKKKYLFFICLGFLPYIFLIGACIYSYFNGSGLVGDSGGLSSAMFVLFAFMTSFWYIYVSAIALIIWSSYQLYQSNKQNNEVHIIEYETLENKSSENRNLNRAIIIEYLLIIFSIIILRSLVPFLYAYIVGDNTGIDGIGQAIVSATILRTIVYVVVFIFFVINPIRILFAHKTEFKDIVPKIKKIIYIIITLLPILYGMFTILQRPISNYMYKIKYQTGKNAYTVSPENYKLPIEFYNELKDRGLLYDSNTYRLRNELNADHDCTTYIHINGNIVGQKCYEKSTMVGIEESTYYDTNKIGIKNMYQDKYPVYLYNSILTLPSKNENMQYAALGRFSSNSDDYGDYRSEFNDYYIECKIMYVDGDIYAIIGLGESYDVRKDLEKNEDALFNYNYPYNMILSEKNSITTYYNEKYYPDGAIENSGSRYEMVPNTNVNDVSHYPIREVKRLDIDTINRIAKELQEGVLKESIERHFNK